MKIVERLSGLQALIHPNHDEDFDGEIASQSSAVDTSLESPRGGSSFLWVGVNHHLNRSEVDEFTRYLQRWLSTGELAKRPRPAEEQQEEKYSPAEVPRPLLGIEPEYIWRRRRYLELVATISRYAGCQVTYTTHVALAIQSWISEIAQHVAYFTKREAVINGGSDE